jgi:hypothetical protein
MAGASGRDAESSGIGVVVVSVAFAFFIAGIAGTKLALATAGTADSLVADTAVVRSAAFRRGSAPSSVGALPDCTIQSHVEPLGVTAVAVASFDGVGFVGYCSEEVGVDVGLVVIAANHAVVARISGAFAEGGATASLGVLTGFGKWPTSPLVTIGWTEVTAKVCSPLAGGSAIVGAEGEGPVNTVAKAATSKGRRMGSATISGAGSLVG